MPRILSVELVSLTTFVAVKFGLFHGLFTSFGIVRLHANEKSKLIKKEDKGTKRRSKNFFILE